MGGQAATHGPSSDGPRTGDPAMGTVRVEVADALDGVAAADWNRVAGGDSPFLRHEFLVALERQGCLGERFGWLPQHLLAWQDEQLVGAAPMYLKDNSYGEFVFDWAWADAYERAGLAYYPKLVTAVPYTPATGARLLVDGATAPDRVRHALIHTALDHAGNLGVSSLHWLFTDEDDTDALRRQGHMLRSGCQFHWTNPGYRDFQDFLDTLSSKKRKQIRRERRDVERAGLQVEVLPGDQVSDAQWTVYHRFYESTFDRKWGMPTLSEGFFREIGATLGPDVILVLARDSGGYVAGSLSLRGRDALFGRHWGCNAYYPGLHFELCYYRTIDYCIRHGLRRFEAGAQGEHKLSRGFLPVTTWSAHWIGHRGFRDAIAEFLLRERAQIRGYVQAAAAHSPYRQGGAVPGIDGAAEG